LTSLGRQSDRRAAIEASVLEATEALLAEGATYPELNIERIAKRAGISRTAFYFYFRDKRELLMRLAEDVTQRLYAEGDVWFTDSDDPAEELGQAIRNSAALYREHGELLRALADAATTDEELARFWHGIIDRFVDRAQQRIEAARADGRGGPGEPRATASALCWMTERTFHQQSFLGDPLPQNELLDALTGIWVRVIYGD
jgi:TetR/AcrR family transcriptional regulator, ethionamide resistance regulator